MFLLFILCFLPHSVFLSCLTCFSSQPTNPVLRATQWLLPILFPCPLRLFCLTACIVTRIKPYFHDCMSFGTVFFYNLSLMRARMHCCFLLSRKRPAEVETRAPWDVHGRAHFNSARCPGQNKDNSDCWLDFIKVPTKTVLRHIHFFHPMPYQ